jgi:hypothetical protein
MNEKALQELSPKDKNYMEEILAKELNALSEAERAHLVARRGYLTGETLERYEIDGAESEGGGNIDEYEAMSVKELKAMCNEREIVVDKSVTKKADLVEILRSDDAGELEEEDEEVTE